MPTTSPTIGLIGAGMIGTRFIRAIVAAGWPLTAFDTDAAKQDAAAALGARTARSAREVVERSDVVLLALPGSHAVEAAMEGVCGILEAIGPRHLVIDTGTSRPQTDVEYAARVRERGGRMIDAPITGRAKGLIFMVGGDPEEYARAEQVLQLLAYKVVHCGPLGHGQRMKLVNQFILAGRLAVFSEGAHLARRMGLDPEQIASGLEFADAGGAINPRVSVPGSQLLWLHTKDLEYLADLVETEGIYAPLTPLITHVFQETRDRGERDWSQAAITTHWEQE